MFYVHFPVISPEQHAASVRQNNFYGNITANKILLHQAFIAGRYTVHLRELSGYINSKNAKKSCGIYKFINKNTSISIYLTFI